jgi:hypothetical protein
MNRQTLILGLIVVVGCLVLGLLWSQPLAGQAPAAPAGKVGKYQVSVCSLGADPTRVAILCDTETGQLWQARLQPPSGPGFVWQRIIGSPVQEKKE